VSAFCLHSWIGEAPGNLLRSERQESSVWGLDFGPHWGQSVFIGWCCLNKLMWSDLVSIDFLLLSPGGEGYLRVL
ncbi:peroxisome proliferator-activated receptor alpha a isoform X1, partial [Tachysurus ichikawai]